MDTVTVKPEDIEPRTTAPSFASTAETSSSEEYFTIIANSEDMVV
jgi:hypothetical protein